MRAFKRHTRIACAHWYLRDNSNRTKYSIDHIDAVGVFTYPILGCLPTTTHMDDQLMIMDVLTNAAASHGSQLDHHQPNIAPDRGRGVLKWGVPPKTSQKKWMFHDFPANKPSIQGNSIGTPHVIPRKDTRFWTLLVCPPSRLTCCAAASSSEDANAW